VGKGKGKGKGKGWIVAVGGWMPLDGFIYIIALMLSSRLFRLISVAFSSRAGEMS